MSTITPTYVSRAFWAMSDHFKELLNQGSLNPGTPGVTSWDVHLHPAHEIVTFEATTDNQVSAAWTTVDPATRELELNEVRIAPQVFDLIFTPAIH